uniref:BTB domain-containing protein n=1 Tax=Panagrolaimus davidi TaxID=227884 RepID=A0A914QVC2_9BILA
MISSMNYINKLQTQLESAFQSQDPELLDIVFDFEGKKIYADKLSLSNNSSTFESMLSDRWTFKNDAIKIETYKFDDFKELLTFIYSGKCNITNENIFTILDMSEFYQIEDLKKICDVFLSKTKLNLSNVLQHFETSNKYSLIQMKEPIQTFIFQNFANLAKFEGFLNADKSIIKEIVAMESNFSKHHEDMFQSVIKITNSLGKSVYCDLSGKQKYEIEIMKSLIGRESENKNPLSIYWDVCCKKPSTPSPLKKRDGVQWYLTYFVDGDIGVIRCSVLVFGYYLIAEMFAETDFEVTRFCKIEIE